ncbi:MAG: prepilin-type N-terminal cleavage/methylation domain-containing protein [Deltaproteobacteria bacterium]|jgi:prepilin-type N-terminal cleavage/methylation domain-containing protein|nr:prepilin-type N-terminal cleavage/methylation domain-containing protein [Deltaproteobacteria bacterium]
MTISAKTCVGKGSAGFSLLELIVGMAVIAILAGITYAGLSRYIPRYRVRAEAKVYDGLLQKARLLAATSQKPVRVVLDCAKAVNDACLVNTQIASYTGAEVTDWRSVPNGDHELHPDVMAAKTPTPSTYDGSASYAGKYWTIFMPDSRVYSDPRPFALFFHIAGADTGQLTPGWQISVSNDAGRIFLEQTSIRPNV